MYSYDHIISTLIINNINLNKNIFHSINNIQVMYIKSNIVQATNNEMWSWLQLIHCLSHYRPLRIITLMRTPHALNFFFPYTKTQLTERKNIDINLDVSSSTPRTNRKKWYEYFFSLNEYCLASAKQTTRDTRTPVDNLMFIHKVF